MVTRVLLRTACPLLRNNMRLMSSNASDLVLVEEVGDKGILTLNRPKALNAVNLEMIETLAKSIEKWSDTKSLIIVKAAGGKAFSAGGDVRTVVEAETLDVGKTFFKAQYSMNHLIGNLKIPYVSFIDGITMGGGVGIAVHGRYRIATEKTLFAMPEQAIGLFSDVGASYFLPRLQGKLGYFLGLTGFRLKGQDVLHAGIATHYCESDKIPQIEKALLDTKNSTDVESVINDLCPKPTSEFVLSKNLEQIDNAFSASTIEGVLSVLEKDNSEWAKNATKALRTVSPTSLKVTLRELNIGAKMTLGECLQMEYRLLAHFVEDSDFHEGVRAMLINKTNDPKWSPARIEDVPDERVLSFFKPLKDDDGLPINVTLPTEL